jgi:hypothetical protein
MLTVHQGSGIVQSSSPASRRLASHRSDWFNARIAQLMWVGGVYCQVLGGVGSNSSLVLYKARDNVLERDSFFILIKNNAILKAQINPLMYFISELAI